MKNCCDIDNPLIRDGVSQQQRLTETLAPNYVKVDSWELADFLVFAYRLSQQVIYYDNNNQPAGNWQEFFGCATPIQIALISKTPTSKVKKKYEEDRKNFLVSLTPDGLDLIFKNWINQLLKPILNWYESLDDYTPLKSIIKGLVKTNLSKPIERIWAFTTSSEISSGNYIIRFLVDFNQTLGLEIIPPLEDRFLLENSTRARRLYFKNLTIKFHLLILGINGLVGILFLWDSFKNKLDESIEDKLYKILKILEDELNGIFQQLFQTYLQITHEAPKYLEESLKAKKDHSPHLALYYSFWEVIKAAREDLNSITQKHLDFFYKEVLRLTMRPSEPDSAHLTFELAKSQEEYKLDVETQFKAGKDLTGKELFYQLDNEILVHKAQIASLKSLFLDSRELDSKELDINFPDQLTGLYASPQVNSIDGEGGEFPKEQIVKAWLPFGDNGRKSAQMGLAIDRL